MLRLLLPCLLAIAAPTIALGACPPGAWQPHNGHCYFLAPLEFHGNWDTAYEMCHALGAELASVTSEEENTFISEKMTHWNYIWIGLNDKKLEGQFRWTDGESVSYTNWQSGEPDDGGSSANEDCVQINNGDMNWADWPCTQDYGYVCKMAEL